MQKPLDPSRKELKRARRSVAEMKAAHAFAQFESSWQDALTHIERSWNKTKRAFTDGGYEPWRGARERERVTDPLLHYAKVARDSDEHTVAATLEQLPGSVTINPSQGNSLFIEEMRIQGGKLAIKGADPGVAVTVTPPGAKLLPATSRGVTCQPPAEHLGKPLEPSNPVTVAEAAIDYYQSALDDAEGRFGKSEHGA